MTHATARRRPAPHEEPATASRRRRDDSPSGPPHAGVSIDAARAHHRGLPSEDTTR